MIDYSAYPNPQLRDSVLVQCAFYTVVHSDHLTAYTTVCEAWQVKDGEERACLLQKRQRWKPCSALSRGPRLLLLFTSGTPAFLTQKRNTNSLEQVEMQTSHLLRNSSQPTYAVPTMSGTPMVARKVNWARPTVCPPGPRITGTPGPMES